MIFCDLRHQKLGHFQNLFTMFVSGREGLQNLFLRSVFSSHKEILLNNFPWNNKFNIY